MSDGVIYVATGSDYVALAVQSARTLRQYNPMLCVDLFTDQPNAPGLDVFDRIHDVPKVHRRAKLDCLPLSRFDRTLFLDCDTLVLASFGDLFDLLDAFDLAMAHEVRRASELIAEGGEQPLPYAFPQLNSGVVLYRRTEPVQAFFSEWRAGFEKLDSPRDQVALKELLWKTPLRFYVLPPEFNLRRITHLDASEPSDMRPTIVHSHRLLQHLSGSGEQISDVDALLDAERIALEDEWLAAGQGRIEAPVVSRFEAALDAFENDPDPARRPGSLRK